MLQSSFKDFGLAAKTKCTFRKFSEENEPFNWRNVKWLRYTKEFGKILYKNTLHIEEPFQILNIFKRGLSQLYFKNLTNCYNQPVNISDAKKKDLITLLPLIDENYHDFYKSLRSESLPDFHPDLTEEDLE